MDEKDRQACKIDLPEDHMPPAMASDPWDGLYEISSVAPSPSWKRAKVGIHIQSGELGKVEERQVRRLFFLSTEYKYQPLSEKAFIAAAGKAGEGINRQNSLDHVPAELKKRLPDLKPFYVSEDDLGQPPQTNIMKVKVTEDTPDGSRAGYVTRFREGYYRVYYTYYGKPLPDRSEGHRAGPGFWRAITDQEFLYLCPLLPSSLPSGNTTQQEKQNESGKTHSFQCRNTARDTLEIIHYHHSAELLDRIRSLAMGFLVAEPHRKNPSEPNKYYFSTKFDQFTFWADKGWHMAWKNHENKTKTVSLPPCFFEGMTFELLLGYINRLKIANVLLPTTSTMIKQLAISKTVEELFLPDTSKFLFKTENLEFHDDGTYNSQRLSLYLHRNGCLFATGNFEFGWGHGSFPDPTYHAYKASFPVSYEVFHNKYLKIASPEDQKAFKGLTKETWKSYYGLFYAGGGEDFVECRKE